LLTALVSISETEPPFCTINSFSADFCLSGAMPRSVAKVIPLNRAMVIKKKKKVGSRALELKRAHKIQREGEY
jgi:hypothetical protein